MLLEGKRAIVSGIGPGMGRAIALAFAAEGADLVLASRSQEKMDAVLSELDGSGRRALAVATDITDTGACRRLVERACSELGGIDVLVNNAYHPGTYTLIEDTDLETWRAPFDVNVLGTVGLTQAVVPVMKKQGGGSVVMINSMSMRRMMETFGGYAASKAALLAATQTLALELGRYKIRVNSVVPGYIDGAALATYFEEQAVAQGTTAEALHEAVAAETALGQIPNSEEIAEAVVFFASDRARVITGQSLDVNAGHVFR